MRLFMLTTYRLRILRTLHQKQLLQMVAKKGSFVSKVETQMLYLLQTSNNSNNSQHAGYSDKKKLNSN